MVIGILVTSGHQHAVEGGSRPKSRHRELAVSIKGEHCGTQGQASSLDQSMQKKNGSSHSQVRSMYYVYVYLHFLRFFLPSVGPVNRSHTSHIYIYIVSGIVI